MASAGKLHDRLIWAVASTVYSSSKDGGRDVGTENSTWTRVCDTYPNMINMQPIRQHPQYAPIPRNNKLILSVLQSIRSMIQVP